MHQTERPVSAVKAEVTSRELDHGREPVVRRPVVADDADAWQREHHRGQIRLRHAHHLAHAIPEHRHRHARVRGGGVAISHRSRHYAPVFQPHRRNVHALGIRTRLETHHHATDEGPKRRDGPIFIERVLDRLLILVP